MRRDNLTDLVPQHLKCCYGSEMPEKSLYLKKYLCVIVLHDCVPKQQYSPPKAMAAFIVFRLLALRRKSFFIYEKYYIQ